jgi:hypothetical protein
VTCKFPTTLFALTFSATALTSFGEDPKKQSVQVTATDHANLAPGGTLRIDHSYGDLTIEGWDRPEVEVNVVKSIPYGFKNKKGEVSKHLERIKIGLEAKSASEVVVSTVIHSRGGPLMPPPLRKTPGSVIIEYLIYAPRDAKLVIDHCTGFVLISDVKGDVDATCGRGDIVLMLPDLGPYSIDAKSTLGVVTSDFAATIQQATPAGKGEPDSSSNGSPRHRIRLRMGFGGIAIKAVPVEASGR